MSKYTLQRTLTEAERKKLNKYSDLVAHLLFHRGITTNEEAEAFINLDFDSGSHDPFLLKDMDKATDRILQAMKDNEKITIFSDYDADGIPAAVVVNDYFEKVGYENFDVYIPHRNIEGFGLNKKALKKLAEGGTKLVITLDCGISDIDQVACANTLGMDVIVTDHHETHDELPPAHAIVNPKQDDCQYPEKMLCGAGVAFKLVQALVAKGDYEINDGWEKWLLDMVGIATLSDMVPLTGENRLFAYYGMIVLKKTRRKGLHSLFKNVRLNTNTMTETDVVFSITPRINAASRMGEPKIAFKMLKTSDEIEANKMVGHLHAINDERKGHVASMVKQIKEYIKTKHPQGNPKIVVAGNTNWRPSLLGLAATKILEEYNVPVLLWGRGEGSDLKGSCRSPKHVDLVKILSSISPKILETYGGHKNAGGFVVTVAGVDQLADAAQKVFLSLPQEDGENDLIIDYQSTFKEVGNGLLKELDMLAPYGMANTKPTFLFPSVDVTDVRYFGKDDAHIEITCEDETGIQQAMMFYPPDEIKKVAKDTKIDLIAVPEYDPFKRSVRLRIENIFKL